jgi:hypothetical protein
LSGRDPLAIDVELQAFEHDHLLQTVRRGRGSHPSRSH